MKFYKLVNEILQQKNNLIVIFPGRFQPFHEGHKKIYDLAKKQFPGADFFIATADEIKKVKDPERYPFSFTEKKAIITATGIPENEVVQVNQPYKPLEILKNYDSNVAKVVYVVGKKDMKSDPRFKFGVTKKGTPTYFQPFSDLNSMQPFREDGGHGYIFAPITIDFSVGDKRITSASELRSLYRQSNEAFRKQIIKSALGKFDPKIYNLFNNRLG
jgi:cytidyltransferase-like protein